MIVVVCNDDVTSTDFVGSTSSFTYITQYAYEYTKVCYDAIDELILLDERYESRSGWYNPPKVMLRGRLFTPCIQKRYRSSLPERIRVNEQRCELN